MNKKILLIISCFLFTGCVAKEIDMFENRTEEISKEDKSK